MKLAFFFCSEGDFFLSLTQTGARAGSEKDSAQKGYETYPRREFWAQLATERPEDPIPKAAYLCSTF
jgi:hypothetical protein